MKRETKPKLTVDDEACALFLTQGAALSAFMQSPSKGAMDFEKIHIRLIPFVRALTVVGLAHRDELESEWAKAKSEPGPFGMRFDQEEAADV